MTEAKHAPGPWETDAEFGHEQVLDKTGVMVADCAILHKKRLGDINRRHAHLVAAAPDLLAVVRELIGAIKDKSIQRNPAYSSDDSKWLDKRARAAVAKAEGRAA